MLFPILFELVRRLITQTAVRAFSIVELPPLFGDDHRFFQIAEDFHPQAFIPEFAIKTFAFAVLPQAVRLGICRFDIVLRQDNSLIIPAMNSEQLSERIRCG